MRNFLLGGFVRGPVVMGVQGLASFFRFGRRPPQAPGENGAGFMIITSWL